MKRARGPWWAALLLLASTPIAACDRDEGDTATSSDVGAEEGSAGSDDSSNAAGSEEASPTCDDIMCPPGHVCVQPRPYCDDSTEPPALRRDPAYCQPVVAPPDQAVDEGTWDLAAPGEPDPLVGLAMCEDPEMVEDDRGQLVLECPDVELPCA